MGRAFGMVLLLIAGSGCQVDIDFGNTRFSCERDGTCPGGYECVEGTCVVEQGSGDDAGGSSADAAGGGGGDAAPGGDASLVCAQAQTDVTLGVSTLGTTVGGGEVLEGQCTDTVGPEVVHRLVLEGGQVPATVRATTDLAGTAYDAVLYARTACADAATELACNDDGTGDTITFTADQPGEYFIIVDSHQGGSGNYELQVTLE